MKLQQGLAQQEALAEELALMQHRLTSESEAVLMARKRAAEVTFSLVKAPVMLQLLRLFRSFCASDVWAPSICSVPCILSRQRKAQLLQGQTVEKHGGNWH